MFKDLTKRDNLFFVGDIHGQWDAFTKHTVNYDPLEGGFTLNSEEFVLSGE